MELFGLVCPMRSVQLMWRINRLYDMHFIRKPDFLHFHKKSTSYHVVYEHVFPELQTDYRLIGNRGTSASILPKAHKVDFVICVRYEDVQPEWLLIDKLKELPELQFVYQINREQVGENLYQSLIE